jgi:hypothetical protein
VVRTARCSTAAVSSNMSFDTEVLIAGFAGIMGVLPQSLLARPTEVLTNIGTASLPLDRTESALAHWPAVARPFGSNLPLSVSGSGAGKTQVATGRGSRHGAPLPCTWLSWTAPGKRPGITS